VLAEIVESEAAYSASLDTLVRVYLEPLKDPALAARLGLAEDEAKALQANTEVLATLHRALAAQLREAGPAGAVDVLARNAPYLRHYFAFAECQDRATRAVVRLSDAERGSKAWRKWLAERKQLAGGLDLSSFLIMPIQRIPRYRLLLQRVKEFAPPGDPAGARLAKALELIEGTASRLDARLRQAEELNELVELQAKVRGLPPGRSLLEGRRKLREGELRFTMREAPKPALCVLFSDAVLVLSPDFQ
jgi:hypothetical protein